MRNRDEKNKLFIGNLPFSMNEGELEQLFSEAGTVMSVKIPVDRDTGRKRGFAFVEMESPEQAEEAIKALNGRNISGREIVVNASRPKKRFQ